jgi:hypothetical protein
MLGISRKMLTLLAAFGSFGLHAENYIGLDYKYRLMHGRNTTSSIMRQAMPKGYNEAEIYYARRYDSNIALSLGYEQSQNKERSHTFVSGEQFLNGGQRAGDVSLIHNRIEAVQFDINGYITAYKNFEAIGQMGVALWRADMTATVTSNKVVTDLSPGNNIRLIPRVGIGLQYVGIKKFGLRCLINWEATSIYRLRITDEDGVRRTIKPFRQSYSFMAGAFVRF